MSERFDPECLNPTTTNLENSLMGMSNFRPESHVAQQSRRDKLRVQQNSTQTHHVHDFPHHLGQLSRYAGINPDLIQVRNVKNCDLLYDPTMLSSDSLNLPMNAHILLAQKDLVLHQESGADRPSRSVGPEYGSFANCSHKVSVQQNPASYWKDLGSQQSCDWIVNYANGSGSNACNQSPLFVGGILPTIVKEVNLSASPLFLKPGCNGYQDVHSSLTNPVSEISSQDSQKQYGGTHFSSPSFYPNTLLEVMTSSTMGSQGFEMASLVQQNVRETGNGSWMDDANELDLLPTYANQTNASRLSNSAEWMHRPMEGNHQWNGQLGFAVNKSEGEFGTVVGDSTAQGLSLSLSSHLPSELHVAQFGERSGSENIQSTIGTGPHDSKINKSGYLCSNLKSSIGNKGYTNPIQGIVGSSMHARGCTGPLGPFTGYATILKSSKYLKPAQQLLDEFCSVNGSKLVKTCELSKKGSGDVSQSSDPMNTENEVGVRDKNSGISSSSFYSSNETGGQGGVGSRSCQSFQPEFQQRKAKLTYMLEEVCRKYKQYHQQMQMVVSSFESVVGLSAATPYTSLALKTVSRHFRCLKNAISDKLRHISKALGEELPSPTTVTSSTKGETTPPRLRFIDQGLQNQKGGGDSLGFFERQQHVWRPHRGLPERSVAVLRAWLFEHFLHPYPTDTDKHMLATQTGLSRNQVSNWFINARVRVWKPMVEEIHMLETKGSAEMNLNSRKNEKAEKPVADGSGGHTSNQSSDKLTIDVMSDKQSGCSAVGSAPNSQSPEKWHQEKRSRLECQIPAGVDGGLMGFLPYHHSGLEIGGLGSVSLTLGLRHNAESAQQQQQQQQQQQRLQEHQLRGHFGERY